MEERKDGVHVSQLFGNKNLNRAKTIHPPKQEEPKSEEGEVVTQDYINYQLDKYIEEAEAKNIGYINGDDPEEIVEEKPKKTASKTTKKSSTGTKKTTTKKNTATKSAAKKTTSKTTKKTTAKTEEKPKTAKKTTAKRTSTKKSTKKDN